MIGEDLESCRAGNLLLSQALKGPGRRRPAPVLAVWPAANRRQTGDTPARYGQVAASPRRP
jgi:hypothetical protein